MKDANQKDMLCRHFGMQDCYVQPEVMVFHKGGIHEQKKAITDVDVLALRPRNNLRWEIVLGDCKTLKGQSPANRAMWLRGLMEYFSASTGIILLKKQHPIEIDHKLFAASMGITLLDESEFDAYDRALIYPSGSSNYTISLQKIMEIRALPKKYPAFKAFCDYIFSFAWNESNRLDLLRKVIGESQNIAKEIDPDKSEHLSLVLEATSVFAVGLAESVGIVFNQYLQPQQLSQLDDALKIIIWGGRSQYQFIAKLRGDLLKAKGLQPSPAGTLSLPAWDNFLQLVRNMLEAPQLAFYVPQILQQAAIDIRNDSSFLADTKYSNLLLIKFAMLTTNYLCRAAKFPIQTRIALENEFLAKQSEIVHTTEEKIDNSAKIPAQQEVHQQKLNIE